MNIPITERCFEMINEQLWVFEKGLEGAGISIIYYRKEKSNNNKRLKFLNHPDDKRYSLVSYETIGKRHKALIEDTYGNPYDVVAREPILRMVTAPMDAEQYYLTYDDHGKNLPTHRVIQYTRQVAWLELIKKASDIKEGLLKDLQLKAPQFYKHVEALISAERSNGANKDYTGSHQVTNKFPASYSRLKIALKEYLSDSYASQLDKKLGQRNAAKVVDDTCENQLLGLVEDGRQFDDVLVCMYYNIWAKKNGYKNISPSTVYQWRTSREHEILMDREGNSSLNEKYIREVKGMRPSCPLYLCEHDDNNLDLLFAAGGYNYAKYVSVMVRDGYNDLLLGKSYMPGTKPTQEMVYLAYLDAMYYIRSLTGGWHLPFEIKSDKWAKKSLTPLYEKIAPFIWPSHGNKHRGYIEQSFGNPHWQRCIKLVSEHNYSGHNMGAKYRGVNMEELNLYANNRPQIGIDADRMVENFVHLLRNMPAFTRENMEAASKQQQWLDKWTTLTPEQKKPITDLQFLQRFGIKHEPEGRPITITNRGVEPQINKAKYSYDLPNYAAQMHLIGARVHVYYDPYDMSRVLVTNDDDIRFVATTAQLNPRAMQDYQEGSRNMLNTVLADKKEQVKKVASARDRRMQESPLYNPEAMLQGGVMIKEIKNTAEQLYIENGNGAGEDYDPIDMM